MAASSSTGRRNSIYVPELFGFLSVFAALCTIFALVVSIAEGSREHTQSAWPAATASIQRCVVETSVRVRSGFRGARSRITCDIRYSVVGTDVQARLHSSSSFSDKDVSGMSRWVSAHRPGATIEIHYDPSNSRNAVLTETDMPFAGPHTPTNLKLLGIAAVAFVVFYSLARILGRQEAAPSAAPA